VDEFADELAQAFPSDAHGPSVSARVRWPFADIWALGVRAGVMWWESDVEVTIVSGGSGKARGSNDGTDLVWGVALSWRPSEQLEMALEYNQAELPEAVSSVGLNVSWLTDWLSR